MKVVEQFKRRILDLAIRGKLVPQDPNDEPASILLERIKAEKAKLVKAGKIKKEKNPSEIVIGSDGAAYEKFGEGDLSHAEARRRGVDVPFDLPQGWAWCRVCAVTLLKRGKYITRNQIRHGNIPVILGGQEPAYYCDESNHDGPCVVISRSGASAGFASYWDEPIFVTDGFLFECVGDTDTRYLFYWLKSFPLGQMQRGTGIPHVRAEALNSLLFPLPPLAEQKRIVAKIEELFAIADSLGVAADGLENAAKRLDKKILDLAIRGRLVPQDPNDEPASELVKRIAASHRSPSKNQSEPIDQPFEIPDSWEWVRLGTITNYGQCKSIGAKSILPDTWLLDLEEIEKDTGRLLARRTAAEKKSSSSKHVFCRGMVLYSKLRTYLNKVLVADMDGVCTSEIVPISVVDGVCPEYLCLALTSQYFLQYTASRGYGVKMPRVGTNDMRSALIPLPPLNEQKRIVKRVEALKATTRTLVTF